MDFQMSFEEFQRRFLEISEWRDLWKNEKKPIAVGEIIDLNVQDEKERHRYKAVWVSAMRCAEGKRDPKRIQKIICWRGDDGKPKDVQIEFSRA